MEEVNLSPANQAFIESEKTSDGIQRKYNDISSNTSLMRIKSFKNRSN